MPTTRVPGLLHSLRCFQHPLTWLCIGLLLLNDHLLKAVAPSWMTGKLSDFAGLFFFPLLLAAGLSLLLDRLRCPARATGAISFALTGTWFILLKTVPWANALTAQAASWLLGRPAAYALDPTDLLALAALPPAWWLWNRPPPANPRRVARVALAAAALASLATSPLPPFHQADRVGYSGGTVYAIDLDSSCIAYSTDGGTDWQVPYFEEQRAPAGTFHAVVYPLVACDPRDPQHCYRISGREEIEASSDGGQTWQVDWSIPAGRRTFMQRYLDQRGYGRPLDAPPRDIVFFEHGGSRYVLVAVGPEGVMRRLLPDGEWERIGICNAQPTPYLDTKDVLLLVRWETAAAFGLALLALCGSCAVVAWTNRRRLSTADLPRRSPWWIVRPMLIATLVGLGLAALYGSYLGWLAYALPSALGLPIPLTGLLLLGLGSISPAVGLVLTARRMTGALHDPGLTRATVVIGLLTGAAVLLAGIIPWIVWAGGGIATYETVWLVALLAMLAVIAGGLALVWWAGKNTPDD